MATIYFQIRNGSRATGKVIHEAVAAENHIFKFIKDLSKRCKKVAPLSARIALKSQGGRFE